MKKTIKNTKQQSFVELQKYVAITMGVLLVLFIVAQFVVLDFAGNHGPEITNLRREQSEIKLENDLKRATIDEMSASQNVKSFASENLGYVSTKVNTLHKTDTQITALSNNQ